MTKSNSRKEVLTLSHHSQVWSIIVKRSLTMGGVNMMAQDTSMVGNQKEMKSVIQFHVCILFSLVTSA